MATQTERGYTGLTHVLKNVDVFSIGNQLALSALFEYLRYWSTAIINIQFLQCEGRL